MKSVDLNFFEVESKNRQDLLCKYQLDSEIITEFKKKIKQVSEEEADNLGSELLKKLSSKYYNDSSIDEIMELVLKGANVNYKNETKGDFPLLICSRKNYLNAFYLLLRAGADVNQANNYLTTSVMASARHGNNEILKLLILFKADINVKCIDGDTALISAKRHGQVESAKILIENNAYLNNFNSCNASILDVVGQTPKREDNTFDILALDDPKTQQELKKCNLDIDSVKVFRKNIKRVSEEEANRLGKEMLDKLYEPDYENNEIMQLIISGANVNYIDPDTGNFPLLLSVKSNDKYGFLNLLAAGADINLQNTITNDLSQRNCIRKIFKEKVKNLVNYDVLLFRILILLKVQITEEDYRYFVSFADEPSFELLMNEISQIYPNIASDNKQSSNTQNENIIDKMISRNLINAFSSKEVFNSTSPFDLIEEATKKLDKIKNNEEVFISNSEEVKAQKTNTFRRVN